MKLNTLLLFISFICLGLIAQPVFGQQSNIKQLNINQLSDQQIIMMWQQTQKDGMSESEAINTLIKKGLSAGDVNTFKRRLVQIQSGNKSKFTLQNAIRDTADFMKDSTWVLMIPQVKKLSPHFGFDFFANPNPNFEPNIRIATPKNYILGPDDGLSINITGLNERSTEVIVNPQGKILVPYAGMIAVGGLSIEKATEKIKTQLKHIYPALSDGRTNVEISLSNVRSIRVAIIGEANRPGNYVISSMATLFNVLYLSGGPSEKGSLRSIELIRNNKIKEKIDFYSFLQNGVLANDLRLEDQDVIRFPLYHKRVLIGGEVKRSAIYELQEKETLADLITLAGGLGDAAAKNPARVTQITGNEKSLKDIAFNDFNNYIPHNADSIFIDKIDDRIVNKVSISGAVYQPGSYEQNGLTISDLVKKAGGIIQNTALTKGLIKRARVGVEKELISFDINSILSHKSNDIALLNNDSVFVFAKDSLKDESTISIAGAVRKPGTFVFHRGMSVEDLIVLAGGFTNSADNNKIQVSRLNNNKSDVLVNQIMNVTTIAVDSSLKNNTKILEPLDYVLVPELLNYRVLGNVKIRGEVLYPGDYRLEKRNQTVQEILTTAGGISAFAKMSDVQVYRNGLRVATTLLDDADEKEKNTFLLQPDDSIYIPKNIPFVEIKGAVFNPQILNYSSRGLYRYVAAAGGTTDKAYLKKAYVQYSNGINKKTRHFLFVRFYPKVLPGSKIIIPEKSLSDTKTLSIAELSAIAGVVTSLVTLAISLKL